METAFPGKGHDIFDENCEKLTSLEIEGFLAQTKETMLTYMGVVCNFEICGRSIGEYVDALGYLGSSYSQGSMSAYSEFEYLII